MAVCCIGLLITIGAETNETEYEYTKFSTNYNYITYLNGTTERYEMSRYEIFNNCHYEKWYFHGDTVSFFIPYQSNINYFQAMKTPLNQSLIYEEKFYRREPTTNIFNPLFKGYFSKNYCNFILGSYNTQNPQKEKVNKDG